MMKISYRDVVSHSLKLQLSVLCTEPTYKAMLPHNLNFKETLVRLILSMLVIILGWLLHTSILFPLGVLFTVTALAGYCPFYHLLGIHRKQESSGSIIYCST